MNNKKLGTSFEEYIANYLATKGWWARTMTPSPSGSQPFDVLAIKNNIAVSLECKTESDKHNRFPLDRVEINQQVSYEFMLERGNTNQIFVFQRIDDSIWYTDSEKVMKAIENGEKSIQAGEYLIDEYYLFK